MLPLFNEFKRDFHLKIFCIFQFYNSNSDDHNSDSDDDYDGYFEFLYGGNDTNIEPEVAEILKDFYTFMTGPGRGRKESSIESVVDDNKCIIRHAKVTSIDDLLRNGMANV